MTGQGVGGRQDGALLIEVVVGLGLLLVTSAAVAVVGRAAGEAQARTAARVAAVRLAEQALEIGVEGATAARGDGDERLDVQIIAASGGAALGACEAPTTEDDGTVVAHVVAPDRSGNAPVLLPGRRVRPTAAAFPSGVPVRVHAPPDVAPMIASIVLQGEDGSSVPAVLVGDGCWQANVAPGEHHIMATAHGDTILMDATHVPHLVRPQRLGVADRPLVADLVLSPAATLTVTVAADGARLPDDAGAGILWTIVGDDRRIATAPGAMRPVHPGGVSITVSTCRNATAPGSTARIDVAGGTARTLVVPLATVEIDGIGTAVDEVLAAYSLSGCGDGSARRPVLRWEGDLVDGMRVALPHGMWQFRLETAAGSRLTAPVTVEADGTDRRVGL